MQFDVVLQTFARQERLRSLVERITDLPEAELLDSLVKEFEQVCERYKTLSDFAAAAAQRPLHLASVNLVVPEIESGFPETNPAESTVEEKDELRRQLVDVERLIAYEVRRDWDVRAGEIQGRITRLKNSQSALRDQLSNMEQRSGNDNGHVPTLTLGDDLPLYLYGIAPAEEDKVSLVSLSIVGGNDVLVLTRGGMKIFLSVVAAEQFPMTTTGMLLLGKQESLQLRFAHEETVNRLRVTQRILPFQCGTLAQGESDLLSKLGGSNDDWKELLESVSSSKTVPLKTVPSMTVRLFARDEFVGASLGLKMKAKIGVKSLEKILQQEHCLAEMVHQALGEIADESSLHSIINIANGFSQEWKQILESSYAIPESRSREFFSLVNELQQRQSCSRLMFEIDGEEKRLRLTPEAYDISA